MLDYKNDLKQLISMLFAFHCMMLGIPLLFYCLYGGPYKYAFFTFLLFEIYIIVVFLILNTNNSIIARLWLLTSAFFPEIFLIGSFFVFSYDGVIRVESYISFSVYLAGIIYWHFIYNDQAYDKVMQEDKINLQSGLSITGWPKFKDLDWFGKFYLYGCYIFFVPPTLIFALAQAYTHKPIEFQHKYIMAGGYSLMFMMMAVSASHISFKRAVRVVRKYNLNWD